MRVIRNSPNVKVELYHFNNSSLELYYSFVNEKTDSTISQIESYTFTRTTQSFSSSFSISIKEHLHSTKDLLLDIITPLDVVYIYENGSLAFIGLVRTLSFGATASSNTKTLNISGNGIEYLFDMYQISLDTTAMALFASTNGEGSIQDITAMNNRLLDQLESSTEGGKTIDVKYAVNTIFSHFVKATVSSGGISTTKIGEMIKYFFDCDDSSIGNLNVDESLKFDLPISSNLFTNSTVKLIDFIKNLLPNPLYEVFATVGQNLPLARSETLEYSHYVDKPYLTIRRVPFSASNWAKLANKSIENEVKIPSFLLTDYTFNRSDEEIYTFFMPYVEGSQQSADFYQKINASANGYQCGTTLKEKYQKYGYRPLICNFIGYGIPSKTDKEQDAANTNLTDALSSLAAEMAEQYGNLDLMYKGDLTIANIKDSSFVLPSIGSVIPFCGGQFYVTTEKHSWKFGNVPTINYSLERGGKYIKGVFSQLTGLSRRFAELEVKE